METNLKCAECGSPVYIIDGVIHRTCDHEDATIIADLSATAYGISSMDD